MGTMTVIWPPTSIGAGLVTTVQLTGGDKFVVLSKLKLPASAGQEISRPPGTRETVSAWTIVLTEAELSDLCGSVMAELHEAVLVNVPATVGRTVIVLVVALPLPKSTRLVNVTTRPATV